MDAMVLLPALLSLMVAVVVAYVTVQLSLWRFYREKWWERKLAVYTSVIESLHHIKSSAEHRWEALVFAAPVVEAEKKSLDEKYRAARAELRKCADIGEFLLSPEAVDVLDNFERQAEAARNANTYDKHLDGMLVAVSDALVGIKEVAKHDLRLSSGPFESMMAWFSRRARMSRGKEHKSS